MHLKDFQIQTLLIEILIIVCMFKDPIMLGRQKPEPYCKTVNTFIHVQMVFKILFKHQSINMISNKDSNTRFRIRKHCKWKVVNYTYISDFRIAWEYENRILRLDIWYVSLRLSEQKKFHQHSKMHGLIHFTRIWVYIINGRLSRK